MNKEYIASEYRRMHKEKRFSGCSLEKYISYIKRICKLYKIESILDYGCGKARVHSQETFAPKVVLYDPYHELHDKKPSGSFDMVICTDVMEHVPEDDVDDVIADLISYADRYLFVSISTKLAKKKFSNGMNVHVTVKDPDWWDEKFKAANTRDIIIEIRYD